MLDGVEVLALQIPFMDSCEGCLKGSPVIKYTNLACLKVLLLFVFAIYGLLIFMVNWKEAHSEPGKTSVVDLFPKLVNN